MRHVARSLAATVVVLGVNSGVLSQTPHFRNSTLSAGLEVITWSGSAEKSHILESTGNGVLVVDFDGDGFQDLFFVSAFRLPRVDLQMEQGNVLYRNLGDGTFEDVTQRAGLKLAAYGHGGCVGDVNGDGLPDIYVTNYGANILYRNNGNGSFTDVTEMAGVGDSGWSIGATFFDADGHGSHDLYVGNYIEADWDEILSAERTRAWQGKVMVMDGPRGLPESENTFYLNNGDGTFRDATESSGMKEGGMGYSMGVVSFDFDLDGDMDVYVANDSTANRLYRNRGDATFEEVGTWTGCAYNADGRAQGSMGVGVGDYDGNGWFDLAVSNFAHDYYALYRNLNGELFQDDAFVARVAVPSYAPLGWAPLFLDVDHDGDQDLFLANGHIYPQVDEDPSLGESYKQRNQLLLNDQGLFEEISDGAGEPFQIEESSRGGAWLDLENDGDLDIVVSNQDARPTLMENDTPDLGHWLQMSLPLGTRIRVTASGQTQLRQVMSGGSYASENDSRLHVGLGGARRVERVEVYWPTGRRQRFLEIPADRIYVVAESKR